LHYREVTPHGFRATACTLLNELGWRSEAIERQMAHGVSDSVRRHYNYAQHLPERRIMMQAWADYLDGLRSAQDQQTSTARLSGFAAAQSPPVRTAETADRSGFTATTFPFSQT
jgi:hypothetical protein